MPNRVRIYYRDAGNNQWTGTAVFKRLAELMPNSYKRRLTIPGWKKLPLWQRCKEFHKSEGMAGELRIFRERRRLSSRESEYRTHLQQNGLRPNRRPLRPAVNLPARRGQAPFEYPNLGRYNYHWCWNHEYNQLGLASQRMVHEQLERGARHFRGPDAQVYDPMLYVRRIRPYAPAPRPRARNRGGEAPIGVLPGQAAGAYAPPLGIWRQ